MPNDSPSSLLVIQALNVFRLFLITQMITVPKTSIGTFSLFFCLKIITTRVCLSCSLTEPSRCHVSVMLAVDLFWLLWL